LDRTHIIGILRSLEMIKEELLIVGNFRSGNISRKRSNNVSNYITLGIDSVYCYKI